VHGTASFLREAHIEMKARQARVFSAWDDADIAPGADPVPRTLGPKPTLIVATPVPFGEVELKRRRLKEVESTLGPVCASLSYHPRAALLESVFIRDFSEEPLAADY